MKNIIEIKHLTKSYKSKKAVDDLSFEVAEGDILVLFLQNGFVKSNIMNFILLLIK